MRRRPWQCQARRLRPAECPSHPSFTLLASAANNPFYPANGNSLRGDVAVADDLGPLADLRGDALRDMRRRAGDGLEAEAEQARLEFGRRDDRSDRSVQQLDDVGWRAKGDQQPGDDIGFEIGPGRLAHVVGTSGNSEERS